MTHRELNLREIEKIKTDLQYIVDTLRTLDSKSKYALDLLQKYTEKDISTAEINRKMSELQAKCEKLEQEKASLTKELDEVKSNKPASPPPQKQQYITTNGIQIPLAHFQNEERLIAEAEQRAPQNNTATHNTNLGATHRSPMTSQSVPATPPSTNSSAFNLSPEEKTFLLSLHRSLEDTLQRYEYLALAVPKGTQQALQASAAGGLQLIETNQPIPPYYAFQGHTNWLVIPNMTMSWPPLMIQQVGLEITFEMRPNKPPTPKKVKQILAPARMSRNGDSWSVIQQGVLEFES